MVNSPNRSRGAGHHHQATNHGKYSCVLRYTQKRQYPSQKVITVGIINYRSLSKHFEHRLGWPLGKATGEAIGIFWELDVRLSG